MPHNDHDDAPVATSKTASPERELVMRAVTINRSASDLYDFWRDFPNLARIMDNIVSIEPINGTRSRWVVRGPGGTEYEWVSTVTKDVPGEEITWQAEGDAEIANSGRICFRETHDRGTVVTATIAYDPPAGVVGKVIAKVLQREPELQARRDLRRFKQLMEAGEIATNARNARMRAEEMN